MKRVLGTLLAAILFSAALVSFCYAQGCCAGGGSCGTFSTWGDQQQFRQLGAQGFYGNSGTPPAQATQNYQPPQQYTVQSPNRAAATQRNLNGNPPTPQNVLQPGLPTAPPRPNVRQSQNGVARAKYQVQEAASGDTILPAEPPVIPVIPGVAPESYTRARVSASLFSQSNGRSVGASHKAPASGTYQRDGLPSSQLPATAASFGSGRKESNPLWRQTYIVGQGDN